MIMGGLKTMRALWVSVFLALIAAAGCASSEGESYAAAGYNFSSLDKVAIVEVTGRIYGEAVKNQIASMFEMELLKKGYTVVERSRVKAVLKEQEFQGSDITSAEGRAKVSEIFNVPAIMVIDIPKYSEKMSMTAKLIDVQTGAVLWIGSGSGTTGKTASTILGAVAGAAAGAVIAGGDSSDRVLGGVIGGVAGGAAGNMLSPDQEKQVRKVVGKVMESMPARLPMVKTSN
jgi:hypothetical protein